MFKKLCLATLLAVPAVSMAEGLSYNYVEGSYVIPEDGDGFRAAGSFAFNPDFFTNLEGTYYDFGSGVKATDLTGLLGYRHAINSTLDANLLGGVQYVKVKGADSETGYLVGGALRAALIPQFELNGGIFYSDIADSSDVVFTVGGVYSFTPEFAAVAGGRFVDDNNEFNIGVRYNF